MTPRLARLHVYPVKSLAGLAVEEAEVDDRGLVHDRRFMVVDAAGRFLSQRERPAMALLAARIAGDALVIAADGVAPLRVPLEGEGPLASVVVWDDRVDAIDQGEEAAGWLSERLGVAARLVRMPRETRRAADPRHARPGDLVSFADGFPFLVVGQASLEALGERLARPVDPRRFRPNLVLEGLAPFAEDELGAFAIGEVTFHARSGCSRCRIVDVEPDRGVPEGEVLAALATFRKRAGSVWFGVNLVHDGPGVLRVGDPVRVLSRSGSS